MNTPEQLVARKKEKIKQRLAAIDHKLREIRQRGGFGNLADVWILEAERKKLQKAATKLTRGGCNICPFCCSPKSTTARSCANCRNAANEVAKQEAAIAAFDSEESHQLRARLPRKIVDRHVRAFRRWRRWRRQYVRKLMGGPAQGKTACVCGAYKSLSATMCDVCRDAKMILKQRIQQAGRDNRDEPPISRSREPRVFRLLSPGVYTTDTNNGWDDIIKTIEENR